MNNRGYTIEHALYALAFIAALCMRLINLGQLPLSDAEASLALQALQIGSGEGVALGQQPAYVLLTSVIFYLFNSSNFAARVIPALTGSLLVFVPFILSGRLGKRASLILAFALAFDPGLLALSRMADGRIIAIAFSSLALAFFLNKKPAWTGFCAALALLSGTAIWHFILILGLLTGWFILNRRSVERNRKEDEETPQSYRFWQTDGMDWGWRKFLIWFLGTLVFVGTLFMLVPAGITYLFNGFMDYIKGWGVYSGVPISRMILALIVYELLAVLFGLWDGIRGWVVPDELDRITSRWLLVSLLVVLIYPSHQVADLGWVLVPLWILASRQIACYPFHFRKESIPAWGQSLLTVVLFVFAVYHLLGVANAMINQTGTAALEWLGVGGAILLVLIIFSGIAWGWGFKEAVQGIVWGSLITLTGFILSSAWNAGGSGRNPGVELWRTSPLVQDADILINTLESSSQFATGFTTQVDIRSVDVDSDALRWELRNYPNNKFVNFVQDDEAPSVVITKYQDQLALAMEYSGQDFLWQQVVAWESLLPQDWIRWMLLRKVPVTNDRMMVWVRSDLFPGDE